MFLLSGFHSVLFTQLRGADVVTSASDGHDNVLGGSQKKETVVHF